MYSDPSGQNISGREFRELIKGFAFRRHSRRLSRDLHEFHGLRVWPLGLHGVIVVPWRKIIV